jgi:TolB-like protein
MSDFFAELKRRHIYRVAAAYAVVAWLLLQFVNNVAPILDLPPWVARAFLLLIFIGFPVALFFAWMRELAPADGAAPRAAATKMDFVLAGALIAVLAGVSYQQLAPTTGARTAQRQAAAGAPASSQPPPGGISIAVLPFVNLSGDAAQEFFSDGMTEEITIALANVQSLKVIGRSSAFQFKGQNRDLRAVGQALGASHLIEGSVRKVGNRVRISAELIKADDGVNLWSQNYDRQLTDIFAIQEDIAQAIAGALRVPLGLAQGDTLVRDRTKDLETYDQYLRARALYRGRTIAEAVTALEKLVARDPGFAPAWATLSEAYIASPYSNSPATRTGPVEDARSLVETALAKAEMAARRAIQLDPKNAGGYGALATLQLDNGKWMEAEDLFKQALALDANEPDVLSSYVSLLTSIGRLKEALGVSQKIRTLEPLVPVYNLRVGTKLNESGQPQAGISILEAIPPDPAISYLRNSALARAYAMVGRYSDAADTLLAIKGNEVTRQSVEAAARLLRSAPTKVSAPEALPVLEGALAFVYAYVGALDRVLDQPERRFEVRGGGFDQGIWSPAFAPLRKTERFKAFARKAGLVDYWRARGWPDLCRPMGTDDFVCD